jgi:hypothetical protein
MMAAGAPALAAHGAGLAAGGWSVDGMSAPSLPAWAKTPKTAQPRQRTSTTTALPRHPKHEGVVRSPEVLPSRYSDPLLRGSRPLDPLLSGRRGW